MFVIPLTSNSWSGVEGYCKVSSGGTKKEVREDLLGHPEARGILNVSYIQIAMQKGCPTISRVLYISFVWSLAVQEMEVAHLCLASSSHIIL